MVVAGVVEPLLAVGQALASLIHGDQGGAGQVVEQGGRLLPGQTHQAPHPLGRAPLQQLLEGLWGQQLGERLRHRLAQGIGDQRPVARGGEAHRLDRIEGALGGGIELPQLLQVFTEELQPHRQLGAHREHIDDVAAAAPAALLLDRRHPLVAEAGEGVGQLLEIDAAALAQAEATGGQGGGWRQMGLQGPLGGHDRSGPGTARAIDQLTEHLQLAPGDLAGGIEGFVGGALAGGVELSRGPAHQLQQGGPAARLLQGGHDHHQGPAAATGQGTGDQGTGCPAGPAEPQPLGPPAALQHLPGEGHLLELAHQGGEGHRRAGGHGLRSSQAAASAAARRQGASHAL